MPSGAPLCPLGPNLGFHPTPSALSSKEPKDTSYPHPEGMAQSKHEISLKFYLEMLGNLNILPFNVHMLILIIQSRGFNP